MTFTESVLEEAALDWLENLGYKILFGPCHEFDRKSPPLYSNFRIAPSFSFLVVYTIHDYYSFLYLNHKKFLIDYHQSRG